MTTIRRMTSAIQTGHGSAMEGPVDSVQITSTADFLVHLHATSDGPDASWTGLVFVSSRAGGNLLFEVFFKVTGIGLQYLGCIGGTRGEVLVITGGASQKDGPDNAQPIGALLTVISEGSIEVSPIVGQSGG